MEMQHQARDFIHGECRAQHQRLTVFYLHCAYASPRWHACVCIKSIRTYLVFSGSGATDVVFGEVVQGLDVVKKMESVKVDHDDKPTSAVKIANCGQL